MGSKDALNPTQNVLGLTQINRFLGLARHSHNPPSVHARDCIGLSEVAREFVREVVRVTVLRNDGSSPLNGDIQIAHNQLISGSELRLAQLQPKCVSMALR
jgi:hypothetical protein